MGETPCYEKVTGMLRAIRLLFQTFAPVEKTVLASISSQLSPNATTIYEQQLNAINKVQRYLDWTEINFYRMVRGKPDWTDVPLFAISDDFTLAKVTYRVKNIEFTSSVHCTAGHVFSFVTRPSIKKYCFEKPELIQGQIVTDPAATPLELPASIRLPRSFHPWHNNPRANTNEWQVLHPDETYVVHLPEFDFAVLATRFGDEFLMAKLDETSNTLYYASPGESVVSLSGSFGEIMARESLHSNAG